MKWSILLGLFLIIGCEQPLDNIYLSGGSYYGITEHQYDMEYILLDGTVNIK